MPLSLHEHSPMLWYSSFCPIIRTKRHWNQKTTCLLWCICRTIPSKRRQWLHPVEETLAPVFFALFFFVLCFTRFYSIDWVQIAGAIPGCLSPQHFQMKANNCRTPLHFLELVHVLLYGLKAGELARSAAIVLAQSTVK